MKNMWILLSALFFSQLSYAQSTAPKYVFYLHGAIVQQQGENAVSSAYGKYMYRAIVDSLKKNGFIVISEVRPKDVLFDAYCGKVAVQVDSLLLTGVRPQNITVLGASAGAAMALEVAMITANRQINYALMGVCSDTSPRKYQQKKICGNFFSVYESSDGPGSCKELLFNRSCVSGFKEVKLNMGNGHGFLYQPYKEWLHPLVQWINESAERQ
jgi:hypothetical protein